MPELLVYAIVVLIAAALAVPGGLLMRWWYHRVINDALDQRRYMPDLIDYERERRQQERRLR
jgi:hypothetical protein